MLCKKIQIQKTILYRLRRLSGLGVVFGCAASLAISTTACAAVSQTCRDPEIWVFSTRHLPGICKVPTVVNPSVQRFESTSCRWLADDLGTLLGGKGPLIIFLHGNRYDAYSAKQQGIKLSRRCDALTALGENTQLMIYSWPSQQDGCLLRDGRSKYRRCFTEGHYLAWLLGQISPERPVVFIGYSLSLINI